MKQHERHHDEAPRTGGSGEPGGDSLAAAQQKMNELFAAGDAVINAALSGNSAAFLAANQQRGGQ
jgi:hypothetical protein